MSSAALADPPRIDGTAFANIPIILVNGVRGAVVSVPSRTPVDYRPLILGELGPHVTLAAQLFRPARASKRAAVVILVPGSGGIGPHHLEQASALVDAGLAVLLLDPFGGRGIGDTIADQNRLPWPGSAYDVLAAVIWLQSGADVDPDRIGAVGSSRGGTAVIMAASASLTEAVLHGKPSMRAVVAGYPWCGAQFRSARLSVRASLLVLQGDRDDWVSVQQCQDAVHAMSLAGGSARMKIVPGALHAFDRTGVPPTRIEEAVTSTNFPTIYMNDEGHYFDPATDELNPELQAADFSRHAVEGGFIHQGVTIGTSGTQAADYVHELVRFLKAELLAPDN